MGNSVSEPACPDDFEQSPDIEMNNVTPAKPLQQRSPLAEISLNAKANLEERRLRDVDAHQRHVHVSRPMDVKRKIHVEFDPTTGTYKVSAP